MLSFFFRGEAKMTINALLTEKINVKRLPIFQNNDSTLGN